MKFGQLIKSAIAGLTAAAMVVTALPGIDGISAKAETTDGTAAENLLLHWDMTTTQDGTSLKDVSGHGHDGPIRIGSCTNDKNTQTNGEGRAITSTDPVFTEVDGIKLLDMTGGMTGAYAAIPSGTFGSSTQSVTINMLLRINENVAGTWMWCIGSNNKKNMYFTGCCSANQGSVMRGAVTNAPSDKNDTWNYESLISGTESLDANVWQNVTISYSSDGTYSFYKNGELQQSSNLLDTTNTANKAGQFTLPDLMPEDASRHQGYMGRSFYEYNGDQRFLGKVADFRIYNTALDQAQVTTLQTEIEDMLSSLDQNDFEASDIELTEEMCLAAGDTKDKVTKNLTLPTQVTITGKQKKGIVKTWTSDNTAAITNAGVVTQSDTTETVHLTASVHLEGNEENTKDKVLTFKVPRLLTDQEVLDEAAKNLTIPNSSDLRGNITLPTEVPTEDSTTNATIAWTSSNENIINTKANGKIPAGVVTRPKDKDEKVTLTATMTYKGITKQKEIACTVRKAYEMPETTDYLFAYFPYTSFKDERIYFGISEDGLNFNSLNNGNFVLESKLGTHGLRDPFIIRSPEGDKFYLIATDLTVAGLTQDGTFYPGMGWSENQRNGSKYIMVWESNDLVNWSDQRMCRVALDEAGCTWAPEAFWDDATQQYIVFWASMVNGKHHVYYATTRDFYTFSEPVNWIEEAGSVIDTTMIKIGDWYYRFSKNEADTANRHGTPGKHVYCERSKSLTATTESGEWELVHENSMAINGGIEGPCVYKLNNDDIENAKRLAGLKNINLTGNDIYCLINDNYGKTIIPGLSDNIAEGSFAALGSNAIEEVDGVKIYSMPEPVSSHGTIMPITSEEYDNLMKKYDTAYRDAAKQLSDKVSAAEKSLQNSINTSAPIKENLTLPTSADGVTITWASSDEAVISKNGTVTRPEYGKGNASVTLTATITAIGNGTVRGTYSSTKTFACTVAEKDKPADENPPTGDKPVNYTVTFSSAGGSSVAAQTVESGKKATTPKNPTRKKYTFAGWYLGSKKYDFNTAVTGNITLTARWAKVKVGAPKISKLQNKKSKQCIVTFKKVSGAKGYRISYTTDKKFKKGIKHVSAKSTKATIKKLKKNKTYYFKV